MLAMNSILDGGIELRAGIPEAFREEAAALYTASFGAQYRALVGTGGQASRIIGRSLCLDQALAVFWRGRLVGLAGYHLNARPFMALSLTVLLREFGLLPGLCRYAIYLLQRRHLPRGELALDGIVVADDCQGRGLGSRLLGRLAGLARQHGRRGLRLSVADNNPRARALYERLGFHVLYTRHYGWLRRWLPFNRLTVMRLPLNPPLLPIRGGAVRRILGAVVRTGLHSPTSA